MKLKKLYKWMAKEAKKLPPENYIAYPKQIMEEDEEGNKIPPYLISVPTYYTVNHARRLKGVFKEAGWEGIRAYFNTRGFELLTK